MTHPRGLVFILFVLLAGYLPVHDAPADHDPASEARASAAQVEAQRAALSQLLIGVDERHVPTGILYDLVLPLSRIENHDGSAQSKAAGLLHWRQMLHELSRASLAEPSWPSLASIDERTRKQARQGIIPIALMNFEYERIRPAALDDGSLQIRGDRLVVAAGEPFAHERVFAAAATVDYTHRGGAVTFELDREMYASNGRASPTHVAIDFDDGIGYRTVGFGDRVVVHFGCAGRKTVRLRMSLDDGATLLTSFYFRVVTLQAPLPDDTLSVTASIPYNSEFGTGEAYVYLSDQHSSLTNPVVVIEGFDLDDTMNWDELYEMLNQEALIETLRADGYDAVVLNFTQATDYIQKNAFVAVELIQQVQAVLAPQGGMAMIGASMGGLVARYALAYMETNGLAHKVKTFIAFDSPDKGANIPLGVQYWVDFFSDQSADAEFLLSRLNTPAARQMLVYHYTSPPGATGESDPLRAAFLADLASLGDYPTVPRLVAVANGSGAQANQGFAPLEQVIDYEYYSFLVDMIGNVWAVPDGTSGLILHAMIDIILLPKDEMLVTVSGTLPYDNAPGGYRNSMAQMDSTDAPYGDIVALHEDHCFIPTVSALAIDTGDLFYDIAGYPDLMAKTPFDAVYFPLENQDHITITPENRVWFLNEIRNSPTSVAAGHRAPDAGAMLRQNYPNPFSPATTIRFALPGEMPVRLTVHDVRGRRVATLIDARMPAGPAQLEWDGRDGAGRPVSTGVYFYRLQAGGRVDTKKMMRLR